MRDSDGFGRRVRPPWLMLAVALLLLSAAPTQSKEGGEGETIDPTIARVATILETDPLKRDEPIRVTIVGAGHYTTVALIQLGAMQTVPGHYHVDHDEVIHVVSGSCVMRVGDKRVTLGPGSIVVIPAKTPHSAKATGEGCAVVSTYAPIWDPADRHLVPSFDL